MNTNESQNNGNQTEQLTDLAPQDEVKGGLTKVGAGTLVLTAANTYTGATTVNQGTLRSTLPPTGTVTFFDSPVG